MEKKEKSSIVEEEMKKLESKNIENNEEAEQIHSEKMRFKHADKIYE